ncbi:uncharacterized protein LOC129602781 [Paramacrobiotus metropolitanus]|uniref:uncharacterized protein LOC129602781 n=1 Tax=Paramacrobiotus metropolitanus TaxID=2943436 RepID=UPI002445C188|nr:uncharacterized protein LOC129602781 [Paramacrobiotus metropolitanus]XP_055357907.1 uncharacterized protein LOC129602781 [Paramacrobiotus metropolitanus]
MMQEVGNDSNGEGAYDFVADAKKDGTPSAASSLPSLPTQLPRQPLYAPPTSTTLPGATTLSQKPSYEFPPGLQGGLPPKAPVVPSFTPPNHPPRTEPAKSDLSDFLNALPAGKPPSIGPVDSTGPDLNEIFGKDVMSKLPPLQSQKPPLPMSLAGNTPTPSVNLANTLHTSSSASSLPYGGNVGVPPTTIPPNPSGNPGFSALPPPPTGFSASGGAVNPFSSQAAATHLPSFSGLPPLPAHLQSAAPSSAGGNIPLPNAAPTAAPLVPAPVQMMPVAAAQSPPGMPPVPPPFSTPSFPGQAPGSYESSGLTSIPPPLAIPAQSSYGTNPGYGQATQASYDVQSYNSGNQYNSGTHGQGTGGSSFSKSWLAQASFDTIKNVTEKAKSTVATIMTTLDPQLKSYTGTAPGGGEQLTKEITIFYIGNETNNMMDALKMGFEGVYRTCYVYTRSGTAVGHKQQTSFAEALNVATQTLNLARSAPQLQTSPLIAVEPFVVELFPENWYVGSCVALSIPGGALLHVFTQLSQLPTGLISLPQGMTVLPTPLDEMVTRVIPNTTRDSWMEPVTGVSWGATVALAARLLAANYRRKF